VVRSDVGEDGLLRICPDSAELLPIADGLKLCEGPVWHAAQGCLYFSEIVGDTIWRWDPKVGRSPHIRPSGHANGLALDGQGSLIVAGWSERCVWRAEAGGERAVLVDNHLGVPLNTPNDVIVAGDGSILFTDPDSALHTPGMAGADVQRYLEVAGVYRRRPDGELTLLDSDFESPNGLCLSPDESVLYVDDTSLGLVRAFDVDRDGGVGNSRVFHRLRGEEPGAADGMKVDQEGNLYTTGPGGIHVLAPDGRWLGRIRIPDRTTNLGFGDADWRTLYITTWSGVFQLRLGIPGLPIGSARVPG